MVGSSCVCITIETETVNLLTGEVNEADDGGEEVSDEHGDGVRAGKIVCLKSVLACLCLFIPHSELTRLEWSGSSSQGAPTPV